MLAQKARSITGSCSVLVFCRHHPLGPGIHVEDAHATVKNYLENLSLKDKPKKA
jgi:hypothetical protein